MASRLNVLNSYKHLSMLAHCDVKESLSVHSEEAASEHGQSHSRGRGGVLKIQRMPN